MNLKEIFNKVEILGNTMIHSAAYGGHSEIIEYLLEEGQREEVDFKEIIERKNKCGKSPFHYAAAFGHVAALKCCVNLARQLEVDMGTMLMSKDHCGNNVFHLSSYYGRTEALEYLVKVALNAGIRIEDVLVETDFFEKYSSRAFESLELEHIRFYAKILKRYHYEIQVMTGIEYLFRDASLYEAIRKKVLENKEHDIEGEDETKLGLFEIMGEMSNYGNTVFHLASFDGHRESLRYLFELSKKSKLEIGQILLEKNVCGFNVFHICALNGLNQTLEYLLECAAHAMIDDDVILMEPNHNGSTCFHLAALNGHEDTLKFLFTRCRLLGLPIDGVLLRENFYGYNIFHLACRNGHKVALKRLIDISNTENLDLESIFTRETNVCTCLPPYCVESWNEKHGSSFNRTYKKMMLENIKEMYRKNEHQNDLEGEKKNLTLKQDDLEAECLLDPYKVAKYPNRVDGDLFEISTRFGHVKVLKHLFKCGERLNMSCREIISRKDSEGRTLLHSSIEYWISEELFNFLITKIKKHKLYDVLLIEDNHGHNTFHMVMSYRDLGMLKSLMDICKDTALNMDKVLMLLQKGRSRLFHAFSNIFQTKKPIDWVQSAKVLGVDVEILLADGDDIGRSIFQHFCTCCNLANLKRLFSDMETANIDVRRAFQLVDDTGRNVFHLACKNTNPGIMKALLAQAIKYGLDVKQILLQRNKNGRHVFHTAAHESPPETFECLMKVNVDFKELITHTDKRGNNLCTLTVLTYRRSQMLINILKTCQENGINFDTTLIHRNVYGENVFSLLLDNCDYTTLIYVINMDKDRTLNLNEILFETNRISLKNWLHVLCQSSNLNAVQYVLEQIKETGINLSKNIALKDADHRNIFHLMALSADVDVIKYVINFVNNHVEANLSKLVLEVDVYGRNMLHCACFNSHKEVFRFIFDLMHFEQIDFCKIWTNDNEDCNMLHLSFLHGRVENFMLILDRALLAGQSFENVLTHSFSKLQYLTPTVDETRSIKMLKYVFEKGKLDAKVLFGENSESLFLMPSLLSHSEIFRCAMLHAAKLGVDLENIISIDDLPHCMDAFQVSSLNGYTDTLRCLFDSNRNQRRLLEYTDDDGRTLLHLATLGCNVSTMDFLVKRAHKLGIDVAKCVLQKDNKGCNLIHTSVVSCKYTEIMNRLLDVEGVELATVAFEGDTLGRNVFHLALLQDKHRHLACLLRRAENDGVNLKAILYNKIANGKCLLNMAAENRNKIASKFIVECARWMKLDLNTNEPDVDKWRKNRSSIFNRLKLLYPP